MTMVATLKGLIAWQNSHRKVDEDCVGHFLRHRLRSQSASLAEALLVRPATGADRERRSPS